jgi:hypothetical protein
MFEVEPPDEKYELLFCIVDVLAVLSLWRYE